ncbi:uncharacterized protein LOC117116058 [Anneissia japonica]|uniref:uncharacterized protein LOC117116058 n=1 Tax=Anneissia japonica TaxID=1529436 RepID=UPI0014259411|nr:uncharacterized protein LOC117116058 [Anneissia japonica]
MEEFANEIINMNTSLRSAYIAYYRCEQKLFTYKCRILRFGHGYEVGSAFEGLPIDVCSDMDFMKILPTFPVVLWKSLTKEKTHRGGFVMAEQNVSEPAYVRLKTIKGSCLHKDFNSNIDNNRYLMTNTFIDRMSDFNIHMNPKQIGSIKSGPAVAGSVYEEYYTFSQKLDMVFCLKCESWPPTTDQYFTREKQSNWPSQKLLDKVSHLDCFVVPVGHPSSASKNTEWRLSFSLAEKELIHNMFAPFVNCMYALKAVKQKYIVYSDFDKPTPFCSYFIKTACLWMCETLLNKDYNIMYLIRRVLDWLISKYKHRNLPHYFMPEQNLIGHLSVERCEDVIAKLTNVKTDIWTMVMSSLYLVNTDEYSYRPIDYLCDNLNMPKLNGYDDLKDMSNYQWDTEFLAKCISKIRPGGRMYRSTIYYQCWKWTENLLNLVFLQIDFLIKVRTHHSEILGVPEEIILPFVENIKKIVPLQCREMLKTQLYRMIGNTYAYLLIYLRKSYGCHKILTLYKNKPLYYYKLGAEMVYFNEMSDGGIGSLVLEVQYHYLFGNYEALKMLLAEYKPLLIKLKENVFFMNEFHGININPGQHSSLVMSAWTIDEKLYKCLKCRPTFGLGLMNPIVFVFYVMARVYIREGELENASAIVKEIEVCLKNIRHTEKFEFTKLMIELIEMEILEVTRMLYGSKELTPFDRPALVHILYSATQ